MKVYTIPDVEYRPIPEEKLLEMEKFDETVVTIKCDTCGEEFVIKNKDSWEHSCYCGNTHCQKCIDTFLEKGNNHLFCPKCTELLKEEYEEYFGE